MTKLGSIDFDDCILDALRDERLVLFVGAGVSMGPPANLPDFEGLTREIAQGTGLDPSKPLDRFLGELQHREVAVHDRAVQLLSRDGSAPTALHRDLLRLFRKADRVKLITTNFDLHFETAAHALYGTVPEVYRAPALPLGYAFSGIVHVHGALPRASDLVLTDADFGRAYLTEGWARRFLVDLFGKYTVLFVGYSHNDVVMNYLSRALPADSVAGRFALTDEDVNWKLLGITPIRFVKREAPDSFRELNDGVHRLADRVSRGALDWQSRLAELGRRFPPEDEEAIGEVEQALREVPTTRFLLNNARDPEWLRWLNERNHLDALFDTADLGERDKSFAKWLAQNFAIEHPGKVFGILAVHGLRMNPEFWWLVGHQLGVDRDKPLESSAIKRWVTILLACVPARPTRSDYHVLAWLAERSAEQQCIQATLSVFMAMITHRFSIQQGFARICGESDELDQRLIVDCNLDADRWLLNEVWTNYLKPNLEAIVHPLLSGLMRCLEEMHAALSAWDKASREWDPVSFMRSAIEPHELDRIPKAVDVVIDAARDSLEWLAESSGSKTLLAALIEKMATSDAPLLRRLAVHATTVLPDQSADEHLEWLIDRIRLDCPSEHHEVHRAVAMSYAIASEPRRKSVVEAVLGITRLGSQDGSTEERSARAHFDWLSWLIQANPNCTFASSALAPIRAEFEDWLPSSRPDFTHWTESGRMGSVSPWPVEYLLANAAHEQLNDLLNFDSCDLFGPSREGLLVNIRQACRQDANWAFCLADSLMDRSVWSSDLWSALFEGLQESDLATDGWRRLLMLATNPSLRSSHAYDIARLLLSLVEDGSKLFAIDLLDQANSIALPTWQGLEVRPPLGGIDDWLSLACVHPAGILVRYWVRGLSLLLREKSVSARLIPECYQQWFTQVVHDASPKGGIGRCILASRAAFLFSLNEEWTRQHIIPLFSEPDQAKYSQAWDGFLVEGWLSSSLAEAMLPAFLAALPDHTRMIGGHRQRFIHFFAALTIFHVSDPTQQLLPALAQYGKLEDRVEFASQLGFYLREMEQPAKRQLWEGWLRRFWQGRLQGVPALLDDSEIVRMLDWLPHLGDMFGEAASLAVQFRPIRLEQTSCVYDLFDCRQVTDFPDETAELLIYLSSCPGSSLYRGELAGIFARLSSISEVLRGRVTEAFAIAGMPTLRDRE